MSISEKIVEGLVWATSSAIKSELSGALGFGVIAAIGAVAKWQTHEAIRPWATTPAYVGVLAGLAYSSSMQFDKFALGCATAGALLSNYYYGCKGKNKNDYFDIDIGAFNVGKILDNAGLGALLGTAVYAGVQAIASRG